MVEVKPINISLNQHSPSLSVGTAISPTLTEEFITHPSVYSEIEKLGHAKSDVLLNESESSLGAHAYAYSCGVSFPNVSVSNVIKNCSYDLPYVENFNTRNDSSSLIKDYKCNKIKSTKLKLSIVREKCSDIVLCKKANGAMKTSSVEFISRSPNPLPMKTFRVARDKPWSTLCKISHGIPSSPRAAAVAKFRLLTGHDCLCAHLFRFNLVTSPICVLCDTGQDMTAAHLDYCSALNDLNCIVKSTISVNLQKAVEALNPNFPTLVFGKFSFAEGPYSASLFSGSLVDGMKSITNDASEWND
ncbi:uncharacterized protein TNCV_2466541 [Trichonephila clavipes]|nr:uncharacterized protein TNCV_2466541 [Trichonephila clavipes]